MSCYGKTSQGMVRSNNEDYFFYTDEPIGKLPNLYIVADGMGGHNAGEVASYTAVNEFVSFISTYDSDNFDILDCLADSLAYANSKTYALSKQRPEFNDMGTTMVACVLAGNRIYIINVGDSRLYRFRNGVLSRLTNDHSFVALLVKNGEITEEQAKFHPNRNMLTRAVGTEATVACDGSFFDIANNDIYLLCSDGLTGMVDDNSISAILAENTTIEEKVNRLIDKANSNGGGDNITVVALDTAEEV